MVFWPFGRKNRRSSTTVDTSSADAEEKVLEATSRDLNPSMAGGRRASRKDSQRRKHDASQTLSKAQQMGPRDPEKELFSQPRAVPVPNSANPRGQQYANEKSSLPPDVGRKNLGAMSMPRDRGGISSHYFQDPTSQSSLQPENFTVLKRPPTLRAKRSATESNLPRRKSSKRKAEDHAREQEIKAMSSRMPVPKGRPVTHSGGPLRRDTKKIHDGLNRRLERPTSDISLPMPESMHSSASEASEQRAFKVRSFDLFTPRPTIRSSDGSRYATGSSSLGPSRTSTRREKRPTIPDEIINARKRIEDLADDMDATGLRELMERDRRRREKKRQTDLEKLQRKLQRRAEKQKKEDAKAGIERRGSTSNKESERGVLGREKAAVGTGEPIAPRVEETIPFNQNREEVRKSPESWLQDPSKEHLPSEDPFVDPTQEGDVPRTEEPTPAEELEEPVIGTANVVRLSQASMSPPTSPREHVRGPPNISTVTDLGRQSTSERPGRSDLDRRSSDTSGRAAGSWTSFFKRGGTRAKRHSADRGRITPSEFSNTSRESFARQHPPPAVFQRSVRHRSGTPVRTQSKFREDLPELPLSPPDSRVQSPEAIALSQSPYPDRTVSPLPERSKMPVGSSMADVPLEDIHPAFRQEMAQIRQQTVDAPSPEPGPSSALLSQSLASVDSEGSWLSGRPVKRTSQPPPNRGSIGSLQKRLDDFSNNSDDEDLGIAVAEDEYFNRLHPGRAEHRDSELLNPPFGHGHRKASSTAMAHDGSDHSDHEHDLDDDLDDDFDRADPNAPPLPLPLSGLIPTVPIKDEGTWHSALARQPTIVRQQGIRAKSREGLLNDFLSSAPSHSHSHQRHSQHADPSSLDLDSASASDDDDDDDEATSPASLDPHQQPQGPVSVQRATSVDFGSAGTGAGGVHGVGRAHVRHISAGSAKLLDLPPRTGGEGGKRLSSGSGGGDGNGNGNGGRLEVG